jgi:hypothetical protein
VCLCNACYRGTTCDTALDCGFHSKCSLEEDSCLCDACWNKPVLRDGNCTAPETCNGHGKCNPFGPDNATSVCACTDGYTGLKCFTGPTPSYAPYAPNAADTPVTIAAEAVGGLVFVGMLGVTGAALVLWKARNPLKQWKDVLPAQVQKQMGFSAYTTSFSAPAGSTAKASAPASSPSVATRLGMAVAAKVPAFAVNKDDSLARVRLLNAAPIKAGGLAASGGSYGTARS